MLAGSPSPFVSIREREAVLHRLFPKTVIGAEQRRVSSQKTDPIFLCRLMFLPAGKNKGLLLMKLTNAEKNTAMTVFSPLWYPT